MGLIDLFKRKRKETPQIPSEVPHTDINEKWAQIDTEHRLVANVQMADMQQFTLIPYHFNREIQKEFSPNHHPLAYMDLDEENQDVAQQALHYIDTFIRDSYKLSKIIPKSLHIPISEIMFEPYDDGYGYSRLFCTPYTPTGKISKHPVSLFFCTRMDNDATSTHGKLFYEADGSISKANVYCWRNRIGYFYEFKTIDKQFLLYQIKYSSITNSQGHPQVIYSRKGENKR